jgi:hypothetical protein
VWDQLAGDDLVLFLVEREVYEHLPFVNREELLASYPGWRLEYLEHKKEQHASREPLPPRNLDPRTQEHLQSEYGLLHQAWVSDGYRVPRLEMIYREHLGL